MLFAPPAESPLIGQALGAALLGLGSSDWIARASPAGGIYGRAVVIGNTTTFVVASLTGIRALIDRRDLVTMIGTAVALLFACLFVWLMMVSKGLKAAPPPAP